MPTTAVLTDQLSARMGWAADTDEVAAILESTGINDRTAGRDYGHSSVFTLAGQILAASGRPEQAPVTRLRGPSKTSAVVRAGLYLTPTVVAVGAAPLVGDLPWYATTGLLVAGWGAAQSLAFLGYRSANQRSLSAAARRLAAGFGALAVLWTALLAMSGASAMSYLVSGAQLALFAANTAALVTGGERRTLAASAGCWIGTVAFLTGADRVGVGLTLASLAAMVVVAYLPAWRRSRAPWRPDLSRYTTAAGHGIIGAGQAVLFVLVALQQTGTVAPIATSAPLLIGVPLTELMLLWHQQRVAEGRARLTDREGFRRHLRQVSGRTGLALAAPLVIGAALAASATTATGWAVTACTLLAGINALCLVLVAHSRPVSAIMLVWLGAPLIVLTAMTISILLPRDTASITQGSALVLLLLYPPALIAALHAVKDPRSYR